MYIEYAKRNDAAEYLLPFGLTNCNFICSIKKLTFSEESGASEDVFSCKNASTSSNEWMDVSVCGSLVVLDCSKCKALEIEN